jgi:hypothetical protein
MAKIIPIDKKKKIEITSRTIRTQRLSVSMYLAKIRDKEHWVVCIRTNSGQHFFIRTRFKEIGMRKAVHDTIVDFRNHVNSLSGLELHE